VALTLPVGALPPLDAVDAPSVLVAAGVPPDDDPPPPPDAPDEPAEPAEAELA
jgi:hypothetical protein